MQKTSHIKQIFVLLNVLFAIELAAQSTSPKDFGYRYLIANYKGTTVEALIKSKHGEDSIKKPLFFFCQGSLPVPLIKYDSASTYDVFPFRPDSLLKKYHLVIVSKPGIPVVVNVKKLAPLFCYQDSTGQFPKAYSENNLLSYYSKRNIALLKYLLTEDWVDPTQLIVAGHSEGSTVAAKMACDYKKITHLIYAGGNPLGRIMSIVQKSRAEESDTDSTRFGEYEFSYWADVVANKTSIDDVRGDTDKATYEFSIPPIDYMKVLKIPVLVSYGTKDWSAPFNDYMRVEMIRQQKRNFTFRAYVNAEHNFFPVDANNKPDYKNYNWDNVANDWARWLENSALSLKKRSK